MEWELWWKYPPGSCEKEINKKKIARGGVKVVLYDLAFWRLELTHFITVTRNLGVNANNEQQALN